VAADTAFSGLCYSPTEFCLPALCAMASFGLSQEGVIFAGLAKGSFYILGLKAF